MIKQSWLLSLALAFCAVATASAQTKMVVTEKQGAGREYATADIRKITFADNMMLVNLAKSVDKIELAGIKTITFGDGPTSVSHVTTSMNEAVVYNLQGNVVDKASLGKGIYIVKQGNSTRKVVVK